MQNMTEGLGQLSTAGDAAIEKLDSAREPVADALDTAANTVKRYSSTGGDRLEEVALSTAEWLGCAAGYIRGHDLREMAGDGREMVRRNPLPSLVCAAAAGFLLGTMLVRRD